MKSISYRNTIFLQSSYLIIHRYKLYIGTYTISVDGNGMNILVDDCNNKVAYGIIYIYIYIYTYDLNKLRVLKLLRFVFKIQILHEKDLPVEFTTMSISHNVLKIGVPIGQCNVF